MRKLLVLVLLITAAFFIAFAADTDYTADYAIVITVDGLRPVAITPETAPNLMALIKEGAYTSKGKTVDPPKTLPSHTSLVTGLIPEKHLTFINEWVESLGHTKFDTIFTIAKENKLITAMFVGKDKLNFIAVPGSVDEFVYIEYSPSSIEEISRSFIQYASNNMPDITLIHFPEPDIPGHKEGWMSLEYLNSVKNVDTEIGNIIKFLKKNGLYAKTFLLITADHGGIEKNHKTNHPDVMTIPWLASGMNVKKNYTIKEHVYIYDTAPTVLKALGLPGLNNIDGHTVNEIFTHH